MIIDSDCEKKNELLSRLFSHDFAENCAEALGKRKQPKGFKNAIAEHERYSWFGYFLRIALLLVVSNNEVFQQCAEHCLGNLSAYKNTDMLPFIKPAHVRRFFEDAEINSYTDALRVAIDAMGMDHGQRNVLITHQFVTGASRSESEDFSVGGADNVDAAVFDGIDYVALGHIHGPQNIGSDRIRYCGTPLKYSFSEVNHTKSVTVVTLAEKGKLTTETVPLTPKHDMRELRGFYMDLTARQAYEGTATDDYLHITLTDEEDVPDVMNKLRVIYPNLMKLEYDNKRTRSGREITGADAPESKSPLELVAEFYELQNGQPMSEEQARYSKEIIEKIWED